MEGLASRIVKALLWVGALGLLGAALGALLTLATGTAALAAINLPRWGAALGVGLAVAWVLFSDARRGEHLMEWLRSGATSTAPRDASHWGEFGYRVEKALRQRDGHIEQESQRLQQFLSAIEASPNGVMMLDKADQIEWCNGVAAQHFGLDPLRDRLQRVTNLVRMPAFVAYLQSAAFDEPVVFVGPAGRSTLSVLVRPYGSGMKLVLSQDITERERTDAMRRDFVANVSHEIRTPLTVLAGFVETLAGLPLSVSERQRVLVLMGQQTERMQLLVGDLLTLAQLEGSPRPAPDQWFSLGPLLQRALSGAQALSLGLSATPHQFDFGAPLAIDVAGSEHEIYSAVSNLLNNAVRYTPPGGGIVLSWQWHDDGSGSITVTDGGIGITKEHLPRLTERFYRVDGSRSRDTGGTGLGLSIVKHVIQRHGGEIQIHSEPGKGSSFSLRLPALRLRVSPSLASSLPTAPVALASRQ